MNYINRRKKKKPIKIQSIMEDPQNGTNFAYKKTRDEKSPEIKISIDTSSKMKKCNETLPIENRKLVHDLLSLPIDMQPTKEELEYRKSEMESPNAFLKCKKFLKCTKCNKNYENAISKNHKISVHPFLGVLMCKSCCDFYGDGNFSLDSDDEDKYCRWCGEGGKIFSCSKCIYGFCSICIKKHFGIKYLNDILKDDEWHCFFCNPKPLWHLRFVCSFAEERCRTSEEVSSDKGSPPQIQKAKRKQNEIDKDEPEDKTMSPPTSKAKRRRLNKQVFLSDSEESDEDHFKKTKEKLNDFVGGSKKKESTSPIRPPNMDKLEKILKLLEYQLTFGCDWTKKLMLKLNLPNHSEADFDFSKEIQKTKWFLSLMSSHLLEFCRAVESLENNSPTKVKGNDNIVGVDDPSKCGDLTSYSDILLFLGFVTNQVKAFMDKGISVQDLVEAEIVNDDTVLGIKKKKAPSRKSESTPSRKRAGDDSDANDSSGGSSKVSSSKVEVNDKKLDFSQSETLDKTSEDESDEKMICNETGSTQGESEGKAKTLNDTSEELNASGKKGINAEGTADNYKEILAILEDS